jgi:hypothetical protein
MMTSTAAAATAIRDVGRGRFAAEFGTWSLEFGVFVRVLVIEPYQQG